MWWRESKDGDQELPFQVRSTTQRWYLVNLFDTAFQLYSTLFYSPAILLGLTLVSVRNISKQWDIHSFLWLREQKDCLIKQAFHTVKNAPVYISQVYSRSIRSDPFSTNQDYIHPFILYTHPDLMINFTVL